MPKRNKGEIKVVAVPRSQPDLQRLAKAIVALVLEQSAKEKPAAGSVGRADGHTPAHPEEAA